MIKANLKACLAPTEAAGEAYNIAYGGREYLIDIYLGLEKALGVDVEPEFGPERRGRYWGMSRSGGERGIRAAIVWYMGNL